MTLGERIKKLRKALDLTQQRFATAIGSTQNVVANYEIGRRNPSSSVINNICKTFSVNESWLISGDGEMFIQQSKEDEVSTMVHSLLSGESAEFKRRLIKVLSSLDEQEWVILENKLKEIVGIQEQPRTLEQEADEFAAMAREQFISEKKRESQTSSVKESGAG